MVANEDLRGHAEPEELDPALTLVHADTCFFTSAPGSISLRLRNTPTDSLDNEFALDNPHFGVTTQAPGYLRGETTLPSAGDITNPTQVAAPEPATLGIALGALAPAGSMIRRRRKARPSHRTGTQTRVCEALSNPRAAA